MCLSIYQHSKKKNCDVSQTHMCFILTFIFFYLQRVLSKYGFYIPFLLLLLLFLVTVLPPPLLVIVIVVCRKEKKRFKT